MFDNIRLPTYFIFIHRNSFPNKQIRLQVFKENAITREITIYQHTREVMETVRVYPRMLQQKWQSSESVVNLTR